DFLLFIAAKPDAAIRIAPKFLPHIEREASAAPLSEGERYTLHLLRASLIVGPPLGKPGDDVQMLTRLIGDGAHFYLVPGETWADAVNEDLSRLPPRQRQSWIELLRHLLTSTGSRPSGKWLKAAQKLLETIGPDTARNLLLQWFGLVNERRTIRRLGVYYGDTRTTGEVMHEEN